MHRQFLIAAALACFPLMALGEDNDKEYTSKIRQYTTDPMFLTELVDHLPASGEVPTPQKVLGYVAGARTGLPMPKTSTVTSASWPRRHRASRFGPWAKARKGAR